MPFNPVISLPNLRALGLGVLSYFVLGPIVGWLLQHLARPGGAVVLGIFLILPGVVLGITAKRSPLMHGLLLGTLIIMFLAIIIEMGGVLVAKGTPVALHDLNSKVVAGVIGLLICCSLGAVLGDFVGDKLRGL